MLHDFKQFCVPLFLCFFISLFIGRGKAGLPKTVHIQGFDAHFRRQREYFPALRLLALAPSPHPAILTCNILTFGFHFSLKKEHHEI